MAVATITMPSHSSGKPCRSGEQRATSPVRRSLSNLAHVLHHQGDTERAAELYGESLTLDVALDQRWMIAETLAAMADIALAFGSSPALRGS